MNVNLNKSFKLCFKLLKILGMWQDGNQSWTYFFVGYGLHFFLLYVFFIGELLYIATEAETLLNFMDAIALSTAFLAAIVKSANFFLKLKNIKKSFDTLDRLLEFSADQRWVSRDRVKNRTDFCYNVYKTLWCSAFLTCFTAIFIPIFTPELPYKVWIPFETKNSSIGFQVASTYLIINGWTVASIDMALNILPVIFISFAIGLVEKLTDRLQNIGKHVESGETTSVRSSDQTKEFIKCVEIQRQIKLYVVEIQENFSTSILIQGLLSSVILCTSAFMMSMVRKRSIEKNFITLIWKLSRLMKFRRY